MDLHTTLGAIYQRTRPRIIAALLRRYGDKTLAEDALQEAVTRAYTLWPKSGMPASPETWLFVTAKNQLIDALRKHHKEVLLTEESLNVWAEPDLLYNSDTLRLFFICSDPLLSQPQQITLALNVLAGIPSSSLARAFLVSETAMEKRLSRAKLTAHQLALNTDTPFIDPRRLDAVQGMLYLLFTEGYNAASSPLTNKISFSDEAITLTRDLLSLLPGNNEIQSLLALMLFTQSRRNARFSGRKPVPLDEQDRTLWDQRMITEATALVTQLTRTSPPGYYQLQACISGAHSTANSAEATDWNDILFLYNALYQLHPTPVVALNRAVATAHVHGAQKALEELAGLQASLSLYQYFHSTRAHLLKRAGQLPQAIDAFRHAYALSQQDWERDYIEQEIRGLEKKRKK